MDLFFSSSLNFKFGIVVYPTQQQKWNPKGFSSIAASLPRVSLDEIAKKKEKE